MANQVTITYDTLKEIFETLDDASKLNEETDGSFVGNSLEDLGVDTDGLVKFIRELSPEIWANNLLQGGNAISGVMAGIVFGFHLGILAERRSKE